MATTSLAKAFSWKELGLELDDKNNLKTAPSNTLTEKEPNDKNQKVYELVYESETVDKKPQTKTAIITHLGGGTFKEVYSVTSEKGSIVANFFKKSDTTTTSSDVAGKTAQKIQKLRETWGCDGDRYSDSEDSLAESEASNASSNGSCCSHVSVANVVLESPTPIMLTQPLAIDLLRFLQNTKDISLTKILDLCKQIIECLVCLHESTSVGAERQQGHQQGHRQGHFHGDIKPENFVVHVDKTKDKARVLLIDLDDVTEYTEVDGKLTEVDGEVKSALSMFLPFTFGYCSWRPDFYKPREEDAYAIFMTVVDVLSIFFFQYRLSYLFDTVDRDYEVEQVWQGNMQKVKHTYKFEYRREDKLRQDLENIGTLLSNALAEDARQHQPDNGLSMAQASGNKLASNPIMTLFSKSIIDMVVSYPLDPLGSYECSIYDSLCKVLTNEPPVTIHTTTLSTP
jgi:serine/threonine protein kinase